MANRRENELRRYKQNERVLSIALIADAVILLLYLLSAGLGIIWLKVVMTVLALVISVLGLVVLYLTGEFTRHRSRYLVLGFAAVIVCTLISLMTNYPSPAEAATTADDAAQTACAVWNLI